MKSNVLFVMKMALATLASILLCMAIGAFSFVSYATGTNNPSSVLSNMFNGFGEVADLGDNMIPLGSPNSASESAVPDNMPAAIGQSDGTFYTYEETIEDEDGNISHVYTTDESVEFDDGGLGDAELIITE